jgi:Glycosyl hydrolase family 9
MWWNNLKASTLTPAKVMIGPGTSFKGRSWSEAIPVRNLICLLWPLAIVVVSAVAFGGGAKLLSSTVNLPVVLSMCLVVVNVIPHVLAVLHWNFGQGQFMTRACSFFLVVSWAAGVAALIFLYVLYPRDVRHPRHTPRRALACCVRSGPVASCVCAFDVAVRCAVMSNNGAALVTCPCRPAQVDFAKAARLSLSFLDAQKSGVLPPSYPVPWRHSSGTQNMRSLSFLNATTFERVDTPKDLTGGFYNDGDVGPIKVTWNIALTTSLLAWSLLEYPDFWLRDPTNKEHAIQLVLHGTIYMQNCYGVNPLYNYDRPGQPGRSDLDQIVYVVCCPPPPIGPIPSLLPCTASLKILSAYKIHKQLRVLRTCCCVPPRPCCLCPDPCSRVFCWPVVSLQFT